MHDGVSFFIGKIYFDVSLCHNTISFKSIIVTFYVQFDCRSFKKFYIHFNVKQDKILKKTFVNNLRLV